MRANQLNYLTAMLIDILLTILSAAALIAAFPPIDMEFLAWVGMAPLFFVLFGNKTGDRGQWAAGRGKKQEKNLASGIPTFKLAKRGFLLGLLWGMVFFLGTVYWVVNSMVNYGGVPVFTSILVLFLLVLYLSLFPAVFGLGISALSSKRVGLFLNILLVSLSWTGLEYIRTKMPAIGFPWVILGYSQPSFLPLIQIADIAGVYGVSFLIVMVNMFVFFALRHWLGRYNISAASILRKTAKDRDSDYPKQAPPVKEGLVIFFVLISVLAYGFFRIHQTDNASDNWKPLRVGIAQGNIDQGKKWDASFQKEIVDIYRNLSMSLSKQGAMLIIWPESAVPFFLQSDKELGPQIFNVPKQTNSHLLTGADTYGYDLGEKIKYYNSALLLSLKGEIIGKYDKVHLVPFGEYVPLKRFLPFIQKLVAGVGDFVPGKWLKPLELDGSSLGVLICFESIFPELAGGFIKQGAGFLVNITNDAWFGRTSAPYQHFSQSIFRAVENKVFLLRSANTGISGVIDPVGRVRRKSGIFTREIMVEDIKASDAKELTFYARYGDMFAIGCVIASAIGFGFLYLNFYWRRYV